MKAKHLFTTLSVIYAGATMVLANDNDTILNQQRIQPVVVPYIVIGIAPTYRDFPVVKPDLALATPEDLKHNDHTNQTDEFTLSEEPFPPVFEPFALMNANGLDSILQGSAQ
jgi:hypothetical protein